MNVVVFSKGKSEMTHTGEWFKRFGYSGATYVISPGDSVKEYEESTGCEAVVANGAHTLPSKRQWAVNYFTSQKHPWLMFFEDNIYKVTGVVPHLFHLPEFETTTRHDYHSTEYGPEEVLTHMLNDIILAQEVGATFGGYACNDNHFFRKKKYRHVAFVWTKMAYCHRGGPKWPAWAVEKDDFAYTAECLKHCGRVVVNNFLYAWAKRYEGRGGSRTIHERAEDRRAAVAEFHRRYPGLYRTKDKAGSPEGTEVQLRFHNERQVEQWRRNLLSLSR